MGKHNAGRPIEGMLLVFSNVVLFFGSVVVDVYYSILLA